MVRSEKVERKKERSAGKRGKERKVRGEDMVEKEIDITFSSREKWDKGLVCLCIYLTKYC